jgi:DNA-directed RNA polymerase specialized sigma24 family protein
MHRYLPFASTRSYHSTFLRKRSETKFIARLCSGQPTAWAQLIDRWSPNLYSYIYYNVSDEAEVRTLMHLILSEMIQTVIGATQINNLSVLIFSIAHRRILDYRRQQGIESPQERHRAERAPVGQRGAAEAKSSNFFYRFRQFSPETQQILLLRYVCGVSLLELAQIVGEPEEVLLQKIYQFQRYLQ